MYGSGVWTIHMTTTTARMTVMILIARGYPPSRFLPQSHHSTISHASPASHIETRTRLLSYLAVAATNLTIS